MKTKRVFSLLCAALVFTLLPTTAFAEGTGDFSIEGEASGYSYSDHTLTFNADAAGETHTVSMAASGATTATDKIVVNGGTTDDPVNITLNNVNIDWSASGGCAFSIGTGSTVNLMLRGDNTLKSGSDYAGLCVPSGATLNISEDSATAATDSLSAASTGYGAGIGGNGGSSGGDCGTVTVSSGKVTADGSSYGAGIGGGGASGNGSSCGNGGIVTINGGTVTAECSSSSGSSYGAGIGGGGCNGCGSGGSGGTVYISGGSVYASSSFGKAIGAGSHNSSDGTLQNNSSAKTPVCLTTVTLQGTDGAAVKGTSVSSLTSVLNHTAYAYGTKDMQTDADGKLYLYLPEGTVTTEAQATGNYLGSIPTTADTAGSLGALTRSSVSSVTPNGTGASFTGSIVITFIGTMDQSGTGTVSLTGGAALTGGVWSNGNKVYTVPYSGLSYSKTYTVSISGFKDAAGKTIVADSTHHFTTYSASDYDDTVYYTIKSTAGTGGSISPSGSVSVDDGGDKTYTITANDGYEIQDVLVDGVSVGAVGTYAFENVKKAHTIAASFAEKKALNPFTDVESSDWFYDNVMYVYKKGLMKGTNADTFNPTGGMTRGMFVTVLYRLSGDNGSYSGSFTDVPSGEWYENAVAWAAKNGVAGGVGANRFAPDAGITREQLAVILYNYAKYKGYDVSIGKNTNILSYQDALTISDYAYPALQWACGTGIINGNNGYLNPQNSATRAEVAAMLQRFVENVVG